MITKHGVDTQLTPKRGREANPQKPQTQQEVLLEKENQEEAFPIFPILHWTPSLAEQQEERSKLIEQSLNEFGVPAKVVSIKRGPRLTQFGVEPGFTKKKERDGTVKRRKIKTNTIYSLEDDLALALAVKTVRLTRVPKQSYIGLEVPNDKSEIVPLAPILARAKGKLPIALGADVTGQPVTADITRMPHALIAGATNSGKSICIHTILASLLSNFGPEKIKLLLIDPKMVELVQYNGIPHLIEPVITDMQKTVGALEKQVNEMERRLKLFSQVGKRNLENYNQWAVENDHEELAYQVIVLDELSDLMMVHKEEVEPKLVRLAQMARATGIHLILATQRPTVDVVTGLIKANVPTRIAFAVASTVDSRVILDTNGAENLLGRGDGLYLASDASKPIRMQGCFISDQELEALIEHWLRKKRNKSLNTEPLTKEEDGHPFGTLSQLPEPNLTHIIGGGHEQINKQTPPPVHSQKKQLENLRTTLTGQNSFGINATEKLLREAGFTITREMRTNGTIKAIAELLKGQN